MANTVRVSVPEGVGDEIVIRWDGDDPTTYPVVNGVIELEEERVERFLIIFEGSAVVPEDQPADASDAPNENVNANAFDA